ncbi:hypothetical protein GQX74_013677 [Glossina fuscipes]|nr:hypothetical protein GQX74_013677 [Glossina fuscipes]
MSDLNLNLQRHLSYGANGDSINMSQSYSELNLPIDVMLNSSYSNLSTDKPNSRTSKLSCDVGIQTNTCGIGNISDNDDDEDKENYDKERKNHIKSEKEKNNKRQRLLKHKPKETIVIRSGSNPFIIEANNLFLAIPAIKSTIKISGLQANALFPIEQFM